MTKKEFYKTIFSFFKKRKGHVFLFLLLQGSTFIFGLVEPFFTAKLVDSISKVLLDNILFWASILLVVGLFEQFFSYFREEQQRLLENEIDLDLKGFIADNLFLLEQKNFDKEGTSFFQTRMNQDTNAVANVFGAISFSLSWNLKSFGVLVYIFFLSVPIGFYMLLSSLFIFFLRNRLQKKEQERRKERDKKSERFTSNFTEIIRGIRDIKVLNLKDKMIAKTLEEQRSLNVLERENRKFFEVRREIIYGLDRILDIGVYILAIYLVSKGLFLGANLIILYTYKNQASGFFGNLSYMIKDIRNLKYSIMRLYELVDGKTYSHEQYGTVSLATLKGDICFQNVSFGYKEEEILHDVSFHIKPNDTVGFVGKSGAGKSTIISLIPKLYCAWQGDILLDGVSISELDEESIRSSISVITQNPYLFNMTIRENLKIVNPGVSDEEIIRCSKLCAFHEYVMTLKDGYDTFIGEGGVILSGGLRQRLAIARALLKKSEIILLDEATSSLDNETQDFIKKSIAKISKDYTILIIAHRLTTIRDCDYIIVVDEGKIVGIGTHDELIKRNKVYQKLYKHELV